MIDVSYFQTNNANTQIFQNGGTWQTWVKPKNAKTVSFFVVGAGSGGGGGFQTGSGAKSGGQGGSNGGNVKLILQASLLPDILYIIPGTGGAGGIGGNPSTAGGAATKSFVCLTPDTGSVSNIVCTSGNAAATGGTGGSTATATGGVGETIATTANMIFVNLGNFIATAGTAGSSGGLTTGGNNAVTAFMVPGSGGGGSSTAGGSPSAAAGPFPLQSGATTATGPKNGLIFYKPIFGLSGGVGGNGGTTGVNGGNGAPGCGGGGGGAGTTSAGNGGRGGDGFVIITTNF